MDATRRRQEILELLRQNSQPLSAGAIAARFHVSRQVIVGDIALLRAANEKISATPRGYILADASADSDKILHTIACRHGSDRLAQELYAIVDNGCGLVDVIVEHPVYGQISGQLHIFSRYDADNFLEKLSKDNASPLCDLTGGVHLHTISCRSEEDYSRVIKALEEAGILFSR